MSEKKYCKNCIYFVSEYNYGQKIIGQKDTPIERIYERCNPDIQNKNNNCPFFAESDYAKIIKKILNFFKRKSN